jgi:exopolyphosphatase / guanosine-5'-triphosphate,3'-diphosphate pyrophosphatase
VSERGLRDGLLVDYLNRVVYSPEVAEMSVRARSVMQLGRSCNYDEPHARRVAQMSLALFDSARAAKLHKFGKRERELLAWAAQLHDIGVFLSFTNHAAHGAYFIRNADLLGFNQWEADVMAGIVSAHSKTLTRKKIEAIMGLDAVGQQLVWQLSPLLRLAESLDRSHSGLVHHVRFTAKNAKSVDLVITAPHGCQLELTSVQTQLAGVQKTFGCAVELRETA